MALTRLLAASLLGLAVSAPAVHAQGPAKITLFGQPSVNNDSVWMAIERGFFKDEGLEVTYRLFPSGTTAFQTFQTGQGDIVLSGDLPSVQYFFRTNGAYRTIAAMERDTKGYVVVARKDIRSANDLVGKTVGTRVGSTGSWFISEYLSKNRVDATRVTVRNLDTQVLPTALCGGDIAAFFIWQPVGSRALEVCPGQAHYLSDATGYIQGYLVAGARPDWLATPAGRDAATRFLRAVLKGRDVAQRDFKAVAAYANKNLGLTEAATKEQWEIMHRPIALDKTYFDDFCSLSKWAQREKVTDQPLDFGRFLWTDGLRAADPRLVDAAPGPC